MELYKKINIGLLNEIRLLSKKNNISIFDKILKETDSTNLNSLLTEAHFGIYFDKIGSQLKYNNRIFGNDLTPDFNFFKNSQLIISEVCRINPAEEEMKISQAEDKIIKEFKKKNPDVPIIGSYHPIIWKPEKLNGQKSSLSVKANTYGPLVQQIKVPLLLCIYLDFVSGHNDLDLNHALYGHSSELQSDFEFQEYFPGSPFHDLSKALFYSNDQMRKNVSGVLLRNNDGSFRYFHNYSSTNEFNNLNSKHFLRMQHPYE